MDELAAASCVIGVGRGIAPHDYVQLDPLRRVLGAELAATRKVTDVGWLPHARQIGITGRSIAPKLYVAIGMSGKFNHMVGVRRAGFILAINSDPDALIFGSADAGIVGDWQEVVPLLAATLEAGRHAAAGRRVGSPLARRPGSVAGPRRAHRRHHRRGAWHRPGVRGTVRGVRCGAWRSAICAATSWRSWRAGISERGGRRARHGGRRSRGRGHVGLRRAAVERRSARSTSW